MIGTLAMLSAVAVVEAVVYLWRYRSASTAGRWESAAASLVTSACRVVFVVAGVGAAMREVPVWAVIAAYCLPAAGVTLLLPHRRGGGA